MSELRWNPLINDWVIIASKRQARPEKMNDECPFCPGSGKVPDTYDVFHINNDYPSLSQNRNIAIKEDSRLQQNQDAYGKCEVILYSMEHNKSLWQLSVEHITKLVHLWIGRFQDIKKDSMIKYIYIFENRGKEIGATIQHPHGQIYGYSFIPKKIMLELETIKDYHESHNSCLLCDILNDELESGKRIIIENDDFVAFVPFFSECPFQVFIVSRKHIHTIEQLNSGEIENFAKILKEVTGSFDMLYNTPFPYMMCIHQSPVNHTSDILFHFHVEFYSTLRSENKHKINAAGEIGVWSHVNPTLPEQKAIELREAYTKFRKTCYE